MRTTTALTLGEAARATGKNKSTILRAVKDGRITAEKDEDGQYAIEPAELFRLFSPATPDGVAGGGAELANATIRNGGKQPHATPETGHQLLADELRRQLDALKEERERERRQFEEERRHEREEHRATLDDLRKRLDTSEEERRRKDQQIAALLTDQRPKEPEKSRGVWAWLMGRT
jgi:hypothetical protein